MSKYEPLSQFLRENGDHELPMTFDDIERVIGCPLPQKASGIRAWWSNNAANNVMTKAWLSAGYVTERVDMDSRRLVFRKSDVGRHSRSVASSPEPAGSSIGFLDRIRSEMAGSVTLPGDIDISVGGLETEVGKSRGVLMLEQLRRELGGSVTIAPGVDLTEPTGEIWDVER